MPFNAEQLIELNLLSRFSTATTQEGIKVHHDADPEVIAATERLFEKGLITQQDGGYLTYSGISASEHVQKLLSLLSPSE